MDWRLIEYQVCDPYYNMACDEAIFDAFCGGWSPPTIRFYGWSDPSISVGRLQPLEKCPDPEFCREQGITVVRRPTGGRAVAHRNDLTFSVTLDASAVDGGGGVAASYKRTAQAVIKALGSLGIQSDLCSKRSAPGHMRETVNCFDLCLENEVSVNGRKVLGCAQLRRVGALIQQNSLMLIPPPSTDNLIRALKEAFKETFGVNIVSGDLNSCEERALAYLLNKHRNPEWIYQNQFEHQARLTLK